MPRSKIPNNSVYPYHITGRCINKDWFSIPLSEVWEIMQRHLFFINSAFGVKIHQFVLMQNHFHLMISTPNSNLSEAMQRLMKDTSSDLTRAGNRINQTYGQRFFRSIIMSEHYYKNVYKYVYLNPVSAGVCQYVEEYPFSTLHGLLGFSHMYISVANDELLFGDVEGTLKWLNDKPSHEDLEVVKKAVKRAVFKLPRDATYKTEHYLEKGLL